MKGALILAPFSDEELARLRESLPVTHESWLQTQRLYAPEELGERLRKDEVGFLVVEADFVFEETFEGAPGLEMIGICRNALNHIDLDAATAKGVLVVNAPGRNAIAVAEHTLGLMLALARRIPQAHRFVSDGAWTDPVGGYSKFQGTELAGKAAGIVGLGAIGRLVAQRLVPMGMQVIAHDPYVTPEAAAAAGAELVALDDLLARADFVLIHAPATASTMGLIGHAALALMKPTARLINPSAPGVVDEDALADALEADRIAGASLDVFEGHPLPENSRLRSLNNVVLTPHIGGATSETVHRQSRMITNDILLVLRGEQPVHLVNPEAWTVRAQRLAARVKS
jgi:phosphoglycerate dehydrogenase-like enzyme